MILLEEIRLITLIKLMLLILFIYQRLYNLQKHFEDIQKILNKYQDNEKLTDIETILLLTYCSGPKKWNY